MKKLCLLPIMLLAGCAPTRYNVTGASGKTYTAPDLCAALVQCQNSSESSCYYLTTKATTADGKVFDESYCKEIK